MGKLPRKHKPTVASYFQSESQRKKTSKLAFIYGSKKLVALLSALLIISVVSGIVIVQKQKDSKAATVRTNVSFTQASPQVDPGRWQPFENVPGAANGVFNKSTLTMGFSNTYRYTQGYTLCYIMYPEGSAAYPGLTYDSVVVNYNSTERGSTQVSIRKLGAVLATSVAAEHGGGASVPKSLSANLGSVRPGEQVLFCIEKIAANSNLFVAPINVQITGYSFTGSYDKFVPDIVPQPTPVSLPPCTNTGNSNPLLVEAENASCKNGAYAADDGNASGGKAALLEKDGQTVEYVFTAKEAGAHQAVAKMRNQTSANSTVDFEYIKLNSGGASELKRETGKSVSGTSYTNYTPRDSSNNVLSHTLAAGQQAIIRIRVKGDPNVVVDQLFINLTSPAAGQTGGNTPGTAQPTPPKPAAPAVTSCAQTSPQSSPFSKNSGTAFVNVGATQRDNDYVLNSNGDYVECWIRLGANDAPGDYVPGFSGTSLPSGGSAPRMSLTIQKGTLVKSGYVSGEKTQAASDERLPGNDKVALDKNSVVKITIKLEHDSTQKGFFAINTIRLVNIPKPAESTTGGTQPTNPPECTSTQTLPTGAIEAQSTNVPLAISKGVLANNAGTGATGCNAVGLTSSAFVQHTFITSAPQSSYTSAVRAKGSKVQVTLVLPVVKDGKVIAGPGIVRTVDFGSEFKTINVLTAFGESSNSLYSLKGGVLSRTDPSIPILIRISNPENQAGTFVDYLELRKGASTVPENPTSNTTPIPPCSSTARLPSEEAIEAEMVGTGDITESGNRSAFGVNLSAEYIENDPNAVRCTSVKLKKKVAFIETQLNPHSGKGKYAVIVRGKGSAKAKITLVPFNAPGVTGELTFNAQNYEAKNILAAVNGKGGVSGNIITLGDNGITIRINYEDSDGKELFLDWIELRKVVEDRQNDGTPAAPINKPATKVSATSPNECAAADKTTSISTERAVRKGVTDYVLDNVANVNAAILAGQNSSAECTFTIPKDGYYVAGANVRSMSFNYNGDNNANGEILLTGGRVGPGQSIADSRERRDAPSQTAYLPISIKENKNVRYFAAGTKALVKITFTNDAFAQDKGDRNLWVQNLFINEVEAPKNTNRGQVPATTPLKKTCEVTGTRAQAEDGSVASANNTAIQIQDPNAQGSAVNLKDRNDSVRCTFSIPEGQSGNYVVKARVKSDKGVIALGTLNARLSMGSETNEEQSDVIAVPNTGYKYVGMREISTKIRALNANDKVVVRVTNNNGNNTASVHKHLIVDTIELEKVSTEPAPKPERVNRSTILDDANEISVTPANSEVPASITVNSLTGVRTYSVEAEDARYKGTETETPTKSKKGVRLWSNDNFVEYQFDLAEDDYYEFEFIGKSETYTGKSPAEAVMKIDGKEIEGGGDVVLKNEFTRHTSKQKQLLKKGKHTLRLQFTNDTCVKVNNRCDPNRDRNMVIDYLRIRGSISDAAAALTTLTSGRDGQTELSNPSTPKVIQAEEAFRCTFHVPRLLIPRPASDFNCRDMAVTSPDAAGNQALLLRRTNDYVESRFFIAKAGTYAFKVRLKSQDYPKDAGARALITINGQKVSGNKTVTPSSSNYEEFTVTSKCGELTTAALRVTFQNDSCDNSPQSQCTLNTTDNDRNLFVDTMSAVATALAPPPTNAGPEVITIIQ